MDVQLEEATRQLGPGGVYHVDLQADVGLASRQIDLVPTEVVQRQPAGARHLVLARAQIDVHLRQKKKKGGESLVKVGLIFAGVYLCRARRKWLSHARAFLQMHSRFALSLSLPPSPPCFPARTGALPARFMPFRVNRPAPREKEKRKRGCYGNA